MEYYPQVPAWEDYETAERNGIPRKNVNQRVQVLGWSVEKAITEPVCKGSRTKYKGYVERAEKNGVPYKTFVARINQLKWSLEEAANTPLLSIAEINKRRVKKKQRITSEQFATAKTNGISKATLRSRVFILKWDIERAIATPPDLKHRPKKEVI
ncbi:hypothetical protein COL60_16445 [Bacillus pseudomycoides]|uniref:hypothetical protein n=1 Tax=Bacillus pseudomycoides TaxID=64104 RepID=UPI000BF629DA|nr:hypothetical protein [Bacillus pseudomycoides]PFZ08415.1 hypothetical protein COL60_16445 [Bacillus pseudomycoides]PFZ09779.1 hypothetical protein COL63_21135 [Bacillus pseudomycoides]